MKLLRQKTETRRDQAHVKVSIRYRTRSNFMNRQVIDDRTDRSFAVHAQITATCVVLLLNDVHDNKDEVEVDEDEVSPSQELLAHERSSFLFWRTELPFEHYESCVALWTRAAACCSQRGDSFLPRFFDDFHDHVKYRPTFAFSKCHLHGRIHNPADALFIDDQRRMVFILFMRITAIFLHCTPMIVRILRNVRDRFMSVFF